MAWGWRGAGELSFPTRFLEEWRKQRVCRYRTSCLPSTITQSWVFPTSWLHSICTQLPLVRDPALRPAPDHPIPIPPAFRNRLILTGSAQTALGNYERALEHLLAARADMDRLPIIFNWFWRIRLESALIELWLAKGDLAQARTHAESFLKTALVPAQQTCQALAWEVNARSRQRDRKSTRLNSSHT